MPWKLSYDFDEAHELESMIKTITMSHYLNSGINRFKTIC